MRKSAPLALMSLIIGCALMSAIEPNPGFKAPTQAIPPRSSALIDWLTLSTRPSAPPNKNTLSLWSRSRDLSTSKISDPDSRWGMAAPIRRAIQTIGMPSTEQLSLRSRDSRNSWSAWLIIKKLTLGVESKNRSRFATALSIRSIKDCQSSASSGIPRMP